MEKKECFFKALMDLFISISKRGNHEYKLKIFLQRIKKGDFRLDCDDPHKPISEDLFTFMINENVYVGSRGNKETLEEIRACVFEDRALYFPESVSEAI